jgi:hypothetical protein
MRLFLFLFLSLNLRRGGLWLGRAFLTPLHEFAAKDVRVGVVPVARDPVPEVPLGEEFGKDPPDRPKRRRRPRCTGQHFGLLMHLLRAGITICR